jgi:hypothetical protein
VTRPSLGSLPLEILVDVFDVLTVDPIVFVALTSGPVILLLEKYICSGNFRILARTHELKILGSQISILGVWIHCFNVIAQEHRLRIHKV